MNGKKILVTGATGAIGKRLVNKLVSDGCNVAVLVRNLSKSKIMFEDDVLHIEYENNWRDDLKTYNPNIIIHLASYSTSQDDLSNIKQLIESNVLYLSLLLDALKGLDVELFLNAGSFSEYLNGDRILDPAYFYSSTKICSRYIIDYFSKVYDFKFMQLILYSVYGVEGDSKKIFDLILDSLNGKKSIELTDGAQRLDFVHIDDILKFFSAAVLNSDKIKNQYEEYFLGMGDPVSIKELAAIASEVTGLESNVSWGAKEYRKRDVFYACADNEGLLQSIKWSPSMTITEGVLLEYKKRLKSA